MNSSPHRIDIPCNGIHLQLYSFHKENLAGPSILFIHGFASDYTEWEHIISLMPAGVSCYSLNLPGFGGSEFPANGLNGKFLTECLGAAFQLLPGSQRILCGYSMGARLALESAISKSCLPSLLVLESGTPGIADTQSRSIRQNEDSILAERILQMDNQQFEEMWRTREIFGSQKRLDDQQLLRLSERRKNTAPEVLAEYLRAFGTGIMQNHWDELAALQCPVLLITGELDSKFTEINKKMRIRLPDAVHEIVLAAGHNTHLEEPQYFVNLLYKKLLFHKIM